MRRSTKPATRPANKETKSRQRRAPARKTIRAPPATASDERSHRHRLLPGRALETLDQAAEFVEEMGIVVQTPHPHLPSLFGAAQGKPHTPGAGGFGQWPEHAWSWAGELAERNDILMTKILLGRRGLIHQRLWPALDAAVRDRSAAAGREDRDARAILDLLQQHGRVRSEDLRGLLDAAAGISPKRAQKIVAHLEALGVVLTEPALLDNHKHTAFALLWQRRFPRPLSPRRGIDDLLASVMFAAGDAPEKEVLGWFAWPRDETAAALQALQSSAKISIADGHVRWRG
jgi:hypothetical protein